MEAYPILADRELKSLTDNPFFNTAMHAFLVAPVHVRPSPSSKTPRGSSHEELGWHTTARFNSIAARSHHHSRRP